MSARPSVTVSATRQPAAVMEDGGGMGGVLGCERGCFASWVFGLLWMEMLPRSPATPAGRGEDVLSHAVVARGGRAEERHHSLALQRENNDSRIFRRPLAAVVIVQQHWGGRTARGALCYFINGNKGNIAM